jgi:hypothetical protein
MLHLETHAFLDTLLRPKMHVFLDACVNLIVTRSSHFTSPPTLSAAIAAAVAIAHLFDIAIKWPLHGQWQQK